MNLDDLRAFLDGLSVSQEARDIIWETAVKHGQEEFSRGRRVEKEEARAIEAEQERLLPKVRGGEELTEEETDFLWTHGLGGDGTPW